MKFLKCEVKFLGALIAGLFVLNIVNFVLEKIVGLPFSISIVLSAIVLGLYSLYFVYGFIKYVLIKSEFQCVDIKQRLASWLSSLV
jgi:hypothetical protein